MKHEAVELLSRYLKIDTTNPPGNEDKGVAFFAEIFDKEGDRSVPSYREPVKRGPSFC
jgi:hypothetical protein